MKSRKIMNKKLQFVQNGKEKKTMTISQTIKYYCGKVYVHKFYMTVIEVKFYYNFCWMQTVVIGRPKRAIFVLSLFLTFLIRVR